MNVSLTSAPKTTLHADHKRPITIAFAGGGSGGHIAPALAIDERLGELEQPVRSRFICSTRAIDTHMLKHAGVAFASIDAAPLSSRPRGIAKFAMQLPRSIKQAERLLRAWEADIVLGMGGFVAAPVARAGKKLGLPTILMNLDRPPGKANRLMARWTDDIWSTIDLGSPSRFATRTVGPPVRRCAIASEPTETCRRKLGLDQAMRTVLVTGASQGATSINELMSHIATKHGEYLAGWQIVHLAGTGAADDTRAVYQRAEVPALVVDFLDEMGLAWGAADLVVSRAGANSVAEIAANAVPAIFLPYPHHRDQHQRFNAEPLVKTGGAVTLVDQINPTANLEKHGAILRSLLTDDARRQTMKQAMEHEKPADAAAVIASMLIERVSHAR